jgi:hypothetical protein
MLSKKTGGKKSIFSLILVTLAPQFSGLTVLTNTEPVIANNTISGADISPTYSLALSSQNTVLANTGPAVANTRYLVT